LLHRVRVKLIAAFSLLLFGCAPGPELVDETSAALSKCPGATVLTGIDVSYYQGTIDWAKVAASGRAFAIARIGDGADFIDPKFATNYAANKQRGLIRGSYQFFRAGDDPVKQAEIVLAHIGMLADGDLPPVIDIEVLDGQSAATLISRARKWLEIVEAGIGRPPIVYTSPGFWSTLGNPDFSRYPLWVAHWGVSCPSLPGNWKAWKFWQHSESGTVSGISGAVDLDKFDGDLAQLKAFAAPPSPSPTPSPSPEPTPEASPSPAPSLPLLGQSPLVAPRAVPGEPTGGCSTVPRAHGGPRNAPWALALVALVAAFARGRVIYSPKWLKRTLASGIANRPRCASSSSIPTSRRSSRNMR
jgi:lysozyme